MTSPVLAGRPGECCFTGFKHEGTPTGKFTEIAGIQTYVSEPPKVQQEGPKKILLFYSDIWGQIHINNKLLQDHFAANGFLVLGIDYLFGDGVREHDDEPGFDKQAWIDAKMKVAVQHTDRWLEEVMKIYGTDAKYCAAGYCFGGPFVLDLATTDKIVAAAFAHPAFLNEDHFTKLKKPLLMSCAEDDHTFPLESRRRAEDLLTAAKATYHIQVFSGVKHGFGNRGNMNNPQERWAKEESARGIIAWFNHSCAQ